LESLAESIIKKAKVFADSPFFDLIPPKEHHKWRISRIVLWNPKLTIDKLLDRGVCWHTLMRTQIPEEDARWSSLWLIETSTIRVAEDLPHLSRAKLRSVHAEAISAPALMLKAFDSPFYSSCFGS
jgi:hypothetical protein